MKTTSTRKEAIRLTVKSTRRIYEAVREGRISYYYGKKLVSHYWEKLNLTEEEVARYFDNPDKEKAAHHGLLSSGDCLTRAQKHECQYALKYFGLTGKSKIHQATQKAQ